LRRSVAAEQDITKQEAVEQLSEAWRKMNEGELKLWDRELEE